MCWPAIGMSLSEECPLNESKWLQILQNLDVAFPFVSLENGVGTMMGVFFFSGMARLTTLLVTTVFAQIPDLSDRLLIRPWCGSIWNIIIKEHAHNLFYCVTIVTYANGILAQYVYKSVT